MSKKKSPALFEPEVQGGRQILIQEAHGGSAAPNQGECYEGEGCGFLRAEKKGTSPKLRWGGARQSFPEEVTLM